MGIMTGIEVSASGLTVQRRRLEILMSNLVNANTTQPAGKEPYRRKDVELTATPPHQNFGAAFDEAVSAVRGVAISKVVVDQSEPERRYEPGHPHADKDGFVLFPNINPMQEMVNVMSTTRAYEANLQVVTTAKDMLNKTLEIIK
jgi:flagellar basal-body rod protein FlgC